MPRIRDTDVAKLNGLAPRSCQLCHKRDNITLCSACQTIYYCGKECQAKDRELHETPCKLIQEARLLYESRERGIREAVGSPVPRETLLQPLNNTNAFDHDLEFGEYMRARYQMVCAMLVSYGTAGGPVDVVQMALDHLVDIAHLSLSNSIILFNITEPWNLIPPLYIRLGRDQDAYDFMKSCATLILDEEDQLFLDTKDADVLEAPDIRWIGDMYFLSHVIAVLLIKVRFMLDLQAVQNARAALRDTIPQEINDMICGRLVGSVVSSRPEILLAGPEEMAKLVKELKSQVITMHCSIKERNPYLWRLLLEDPDSSVLPTLPRLLLEDPDSSVLPTLASPDPFGFEEEALQTVRYSYASWYETPGAVDVIRNLEKRAKGRAVQE